MMNQKIQRMRLPDIKKWFKRKQEEVITENITCKNCETLFDGKYCPNCGQSVRDFDKPFSFIFYNFIGDFFAFDARFFRSFTTLLIKPGFLTKEYFLGRRVKYAPPFRIFIFTSFVLFLLLQMYTNKGLTTVLDSNFNAGKLGIDSTSFAKADSIVSEINLEIDSTTLSASDSVLHELGIQVDSVSDNNLKFKINLETFRNTKDFRQALNKFALSLEKKLETESDTKKKAKLREYIRLCRSPEQAMTRILEYMSWAFFLLLPIFALILKLVYIRRKHNYMRHLVFSIHIHSFIFIVFIIIVALYLLVKANLETITPLLVFLIPVYLIVAQKKFYGQSTRKTILKFFVVSFLYNNVFWIVLVLVFLNALSII